VPMVIVTGSCGLIGSQTAGFFCEKGFDCIGIDNNMRRSFFGSEGSILKNRNMLQKGLPRYRHLWFDIRDQARINSVFKKYRSSIQLVVHAAAQPSHDWAASAPLVDFDINARSTISILEALRKNCPRAVFILTSTNKVYGDRPNNLNFVELKSRYELPRKHEYYKGINETMPVDRCMHSLMGASKLAADLMAQEYGKYFGLKTGIFRLGCVSGPAQSGVKMHGFLSYMVQCCILKRPYVIYGYQGKQVRDAIHSYDLANAFYQFYKKPLPGEVYNMGGGRGSCVSVREAITLCERVSGEEMNFRYAPAPRRGDHKWWISDVSKFKAQYPEWKYTYTLLESLREIYAFQRARMKAKSPLYR
jgi:CDP-paratose 2-epimerase